MYHKDKPRVRIDMVGHMIVKLPVQAIHPYYAFLKHFEGIYPHHHQPPDYAKDSDCCTGYEYFFQHDHDRVFE
jgi:hypothetical protein